MKHHDTTNGFKTHTTTHNDSLNSIPDIESYIQNLGQPIKKGELATPIVTDPSYNPDSAADESIRQQKRSSTYARPSSKRNSNHRKFINIEEFALTQYRSLGKKDSVRSSTRAQETSEQGKIVVKKEAYLKDAGLSASKSGKLTISMPSQRKDSSGGNTDPTFLQPLKKTWDNTLAGDSSRVVAQGKRITNSTVDITATNVRSETWWDEMNKDPFEEARIKENMRLERVRSVDGAMLSQKVTCSPDITNKITKKDMVAAKLDHTRSKTNLNYDSSLESTGLMPNKLLNDTENARRGTTEVSLNHLDAQEKEKQESSKDPWLASSKELHTLTKGELDTNSERKFKRE